MRRELSYTEINIIFKFVDILQEEWNLKGYDKVEEEPEEYNSEEAQKKMIKALKMNNPLWDVH